MIWFDRQPRGSNLTLARLWACLAACVCLQAGVTLAGAVDQCNARSRRIRPRDRGRDQTICRVPVAMFDGHRILNDDVSSWESVRLGQTSPAVTLPPYAVVDANPKAFVP